jgi:hypothetical protein
LAVKFQTGPQRIASTRYLFTQGDFAAGRNAASDSGDRLCVAVCDGCAFREEALPFGVQHLITSDGHRAYVEAIEETFGGDIDYAMLVKIYGAAPEGQRRYSPAICTGARKHRIEGKPDPKHISTSFSERQNLNIRMGNRRMTRLTNAFSKKAENHAHMMAIYFMHYNFVRIHQTLKITPAMAAGVTPKLWEMSDMVCLFLDCRDRQPSGRPSLRRAQGGSTRTARLLCRDIRSGSRNVLISHKIVAAYCGNHDHREKQKFTHESLLSPEATWNTTFMEMR